LHETDSIKRIGRYGNEFPLQNLLNGDSDKEEGTIIVKQIVNPIKRVNGKTSATEKIKKRPEKFHQ